MKITRIEFKGAGDRVWALARMKTKGPLALDDLVLFDPAMKEKRCWPLDSMFVAQCRQDASRMIILDACDTKLEPSNPAVAQMSAFIQTMLW